MFTSISTASLIIYYKMLKEMESKCSGFDAQFEKGSEAFEDAQAKLNRVKISLNQVAGELAKRKNNLTHSIEDIYKLVGQTDSYCMFNFYPGSSAHQQYGESIHGTVWYPRYERERLEEAITQTSYTRTNGKVFVDTGATDTAIKEALLREGFDAADISEIFRVGTPDPKTYKQSGTKEIPNTITVKIDKNFDVVGAQQYVLGRYHKMGYNLSAHDLTTYYRNLLLFSPSKLTAADKETYLMKADGPGFNPDTERSILELKMERKIASDVEKERYKEILKHRADERMSFISKHLGIPAKQISSLLTSNLQKYTTLYQSAWMFETNTLEFLGPNACVYWDYEGFIHIFLRHNPDFFVPMSTKGQGTHFQYKFQDIERVIKITLQQLKKEIVAKLDAGQAFHVGGHYYNGNYYQIRIAPNGRLEQFHPRD